MKDFLLWLEGSMVRAIFLDDDHPSVNPNASQRVVWFNEFKEKNNLNDNDIAWITTAREAISLLKTGRIQYISLDHDLMDSGHAEYPPDMPPQMLSHEQNMAILESGAKSGYDVARWIFHAVSNGSIPKLHWEIHSQNGIGRENMRRYLQNI